MSPEDEAEFRKQMLQLKEFMRSTPGSRFEEMHLKTLLEMMKTYASRGMEKSK